MTRTAKYNNADDLLDNCEVKNLCYLWPKSSCAVPMLSPTSPLAGKFNTNVIVRILFTMCRFPPAGPRLLNTCGVKWCVNPYHFMEAKMYRVKRFASGQPNALLPEQESHRHLIAPPDEELIEMRPKNPFHIKMLMDSASLAGYDTDGILKQKGFAIPNKKPIPTATEGKPILTIKLREEPKLETPKDDTPLESWEDIEFGIDKMIAHISAQRKIKMERNSE
jgi:hypothetical protein